VRQILGETYDSLSASIIQLLGFVIIISFSDHYCPAFCSDWIEHGFYSNALGFFGGYCWVILVALVCQLYPKACFTFCWHISVAFLWYFLVLISIPSQCFFLAQSQFVGFIRCTVALFRWRVRELELGFCACFNITTA
jgi:hypothetical protein